MRKRPKNRFAADPGRAARRIRAKKAAAAGVFYKKMQVGRAAVRSLSRSRKRRKKAPHARPQKKNAAPPAKDGFHRYTVRKGKTQRERRTMQVETERWRITPFAKHMAQAVPLQSSDADNRRYLPDEVFEAEEAAAAAVGHSAACPARAKARRLAPCRRRTAPASAMCSSFPPPETHMKSNFPSAPSARSRVTRPKLCVYVFPSLPDAVAPKPKAETKAGPGNP